MDYKPIKDPGPEEANDLKQHPEWVKTKPWMLLLAREADKNSAKRRAGIAAR